MENIMQTKKIKIAVIVMILMTMVCSYLPAIVYAGTVETENDEYVKIIDLSFTEDKGITTGSEIDVTYRFTLSDVQTGFQNVTLKVINVNSNDSEGNPTPDAIIRCDAAPTENASISNSGRYSQIMFGNMPTGKDITGHTKIIFNQNEVRSEYEKTIQVEIAGTYINPVTRLVENFSVTESLKASVIPANTITPFETEINDFTAEETLTTHNINSKTVGSSDETIQKVGWFADALTKTYNFNLKTATNIQQQKLEITINKIVAGVPKLTEEDQLTDGYSINWGGLNDIEEFGEPTKTTNAEDSSVTYTFIRGNDADNYNAGNVFSLNKNYRISVTYDIPNSDPTKENGEPRWNNEEYKEFLTQAYANITCKVKSTAIGWEISDNYNAVEKKYETEIEKVTRSDAKSNFKTTGLYSYTPGAESWMQMDYIDGMEDIAQLGEEDKVDLNISMSSRYIAGANNEEKNGTIVCGNPTLVYYDTETKNIVNKQLTNNEIYLKSITLNPKSNSCESELSTGNMLLGTVTSENPTFEPLGRISNFEINLIDFIANKIDGYNFVYTLSKQGLLDAGLNESDIANIMSIQMPMNTTGTWLAGNDTGIIKFNDSEGNKYSYMELSIGNYGDQLVDLLQKKRKTIILSMYKNAKVLKGEQIVKNVNPVFYVKLNDIFESTNLAINMTANPYLYIETIKKVRVDGVAYVEVRCRGTYDSSIAKSKIEINISFDRSLITTVAEEMQSVEAYMITDNEHYVTSVYNDFSFSGSDNSIPATMFMAKQNFKITQREAVIQNYMLVFDGVYKYKPETYNNLDFIGGRTVPLIVPSDKDTEFIAKVEATTNITDINILCKLPVEGSTDIKTDVELVGDEPLPSAYFERFGDALNSITEGEPVPKLSMEGLNSITVGDGYSTMVPIGSDNYEIWYSEDASAGFDSEFLPYEGESDLSNAKVIKITMTNNYTLKHGKSLEVHYKMKSPVKEGVSVAGVAAAVSGVRYKTVDDPQTVILNSEAVYVVNGDNRGNLNIHKKFEGYDQGEAPTGVSLENIEFKLKDMQGNYIQLNGDDIIARTDVNGIATFENLEPGEYQVEECTEVTGYTGILGLPYVSIGVAESVELTVENKLLRGTLNIQKTWEDTEQQQGPVTFKLSRTSNDTINHTVYVTTDSEGKATIVGIPYGEYILEETDGVNGWSKRIDFNDEETPNSLSVVINEEEENITVEDKIGRATLVINKTVPDGESVNKLSFHISSLGMMQYINKQDDLVTNNTDRTITIGEDYTSDPYVDVQISENNLSATITIQNALLGLYTIEEIGIPNILDEKGEETETKKFIEVKRTISLAEDGETYTVNIKNKRKNGYLEINKTAYLQDGEERLDIGDLSIFKVRVTGTSYYGTAIDRTVDLDQNGYAKIALEIGSYKVTEIPTDGYDVYYTVNGTQVNSTDGTTVVVTYNEDEKRPDTTTQAITNVHTGVGYVKVVKTLEGITNPGTVVDAGIKFKVVGKNVAGGNVEELIEINQIDIDNGIAYGISGPISVGGDYQLEELEFTVPDYFEGIEPIPVDLTTNSTQANPLVLDVENKRTKGNLEIVTETNPAGGPLNGIKYKITEVEINNDGTYATVGEPVEINGENGGLNPSFAELKQIKSGNYLVEQTEVPAGWVKDVKQIVEVPSYATGYAVFEITQAVEVIQTKVTIDKQILNKDGATATERDFAKAKLNSEESFEVKVKNVDTNEEYYTFINGAQEGIITGLVPGTYEIEEVYKPKYTTKGYYRLVDEIAPIEIEKDANEKYQFTIANSTSEVEILIKNTIDTEFKFGGQDTADNYSKYESEIGEVTTTTKAVLYIVNEDGEALPGAKFSLLDENNNIVILGSAGTELTTVNRKLIITGLPAGNYTLVNTSVPNGYLQVPNKPIVVLEDATRIARVEIQKNIPRGSVTLSTTYVDAYGDTKYVPRSKYKVVNPETGELLKFTKTMTGDYVKSELEDALTEINLKSGTVKVTGIEVGTYEFGLNGVTDGYGMQTDLPETVTISEGTNQNVNVEVIKRKIKQISTGYYNTMYLTDAGELYIMGSNEYGAYADTRFALRDDTVNTIPHKIEFPEGVRIEKVTQGYYYVVAIDTTGKVWTWGENAAEGIVSQSTLDTTYPICISQIDGNPLKDAYNEHITIVDVQANYVNTIALDSDGRLWFWGGASSNALQIRCMSEVENTPLGDLYKQGIKITKIFSNRNYSNDGYHCIDSAGRLWSIRVEDNDINQIYLSEIFLELEGVQIIDSCIDYIVDNNGNMWRINYPDTNNDFEISKIDNSIFNNAGIKKVTKGDDNEYFILDESGKVWSISTDYLGNIDQNQIKCISQSTNIVLEDIEVGNWSDYIVAIGTDGSLYGYADVGKYVYYGEFGAGNYDTDKLFKINIDYTETLDYNLKFTQVSENFAIDEYERLWVLPTMKDHQDHTGEGKLNSTENFVPRIVRTLENEQIVKVCEGPASEKSTFAITKTGKLYGWGSNSKVVIYEQDDYNRIYRINDITEKFDFEDGVKLVDISVTQEKALALDSLGRVWVWGANSTYYSLGTGDNESVTYPECISDEPTEKLFNTKIIKISNGYNTNYGIDEQGKIWMWGDMQYSGIRDMENNAVALGINKIQLTPVCVSDIPGTKYYTAYHENGIRFIDVSAGTETQVAGLLDNTGEMWIISGTSESEVQCISKMNNNKIAVNYSNIANYKIEKIKVLETKLWIRDNQGNSYLGMTGEYVISNLGIQDASENFFIDSNGQIRYWSGEGVLTAPIKNPLYNAKVARICTDGLVELDNAKGEIYELTSDGATLKNYSKRYIEDYLGIELQYALENVKRINGLNSILSVALDTQGKVWTWGDGIVGQLGNGKTAGQYIPSCISDIEGTELYNKYQNDSNFRIKDIKVFNAGYSGGNTIILLDSEGKIWATGPDSPINTNTNTPCSFVCISDIEGTELYSKYQNNSDYSIVSIEGIVDETITTSTCANVITFKDSNNDTWVFGNNAKYKLGVDTENSSELNTPYCLSEAMQVKIQRIKTIGSITLILDENGSMWSIGGVSDASTNKGIQGRTGTYTATPTKIGNTLTGIQDFYADNYIVIAWDENSIWTWGYNGHGELGTGTATGVEYNPIQIPIEFTISKVIKKEYYGTAVIDTEGRVWTWGHKSQVGYETENEYNGIVCISDDEGELLYGKTIVDAKIIGEYIYESKIVVIDEDGNKYIFGGDTNVCNPIKVYEEPQYKGELAGKTVLENSNNMYLDSDGNLYADMNEYDGIYDENPSVPICITTREYSKKPILNSNKLPINTPITNKLSGIKIEQIVNDQIVLDENGDYWYFPTTGEVMNLTQKVAGIDNPLVGKTIIDVIDRKYVITSDNEIYYVANTLDTPKYIMNNTAGIEVKQIYRYFNGERSYYVVLDNSGKIWTCGNGETGKLGNNSLDNITVPVCISDIEGTDFKNAYTTDSTFKIEGIYCKNQSCVALDNKGKIWSWGYNWSGQLGNGTTQYSQVPICISDIADTELHNAYNDSNFKIEKMYNDGDSCIAIDNTGKIWVWGYNGSGKLGTGNKTNVTTPVCVSNIQDTDIYELGSDFRAEKVITYSSRLAILGNDGKVYTSGQHNGTIKEKLYLTCASTNMSGITDIDKYYSIGANNFYKEDFIAYGNNKVWTQILSAPSQTTLESNPVKIVKPNSGRNLVILDSQGKVWTMGDANKLLGYTAMQATTVPVCISNDSTLPIYNKSIKDIKCANGYVIVQDADGVIYEWGLDIEGMQESTKLNAAVQTIYGDTTDEHKMELAEKIFSDTYKAKDIYVNGKIWYVCHNDKYEITQLQESSMMISEIEEILDNTHFKTVEGRIYEINYMSGFYETFTYTPAEQQPYNAKIQIPGVNIVSQTEYKALDDQGNLYVWENYKGGYISTREKICTTQQEYIIEPVYLSGNGWTPIKKVY